MEIILQSFMSVFLILAVILIRCTFLDKLPKFTFRLLWALVLVKLIIPISIPSSISVYNFLGVRSGLSAIQVVGVSDFSSNDVRMGKILLYIYLAGVAATLFYVIFNHIKHKRIYRMALPCESKAISDWVSLHKLKRKYTVRRLDRISSPMTYGIINPVIVIPNSLELCDETQMEIVLTHEFIHIKKFDIAWKSLATLALALNWFNPFVWAALYGEYVYEGTLGQHVYADGYEWVCVHSNRTGWDGWVATAFLQCLDY